MRRVNMEKTNIAEHKLAEAKKLLALSDKYLDEGNIEKAKEYLYLAANSNHEAFSIALESAKMLIEEVDNQSSNL